MQNEFYRKERKRFDIRGFLKKTARKKRLLLLLALSVPLVGYVLFGNRGVVQRIKLHHQKAELEQMIRNADAENKRLQAESKALEGDKKVIEKVAREKYGMVHEGETVYKVKRKE